MTPGPLARQGGSPDQAWPVAKDDRAGDTGCVNPEIISLQDASTDGIQAGGKARTLSTLLRCGLPVPPGWVVPGTFFQEHLRRSGVEGPLHDLFIDPDFLESDFIEAVLANLRSIFQRTPLSPALVAALERILRHELVHVPHLIVRSSGIHEDGQGGSAAGQFLSIPRVRPEDLGTAIRQCWSSVMELSPVQYNLKRGLPPVGVMAVLLQVQREFDRAGVIFTRDPLNPLADLMRLEWVEGTAEGLMDGSRNPTTHVLERNPKSTWLANDNK